MTLFPRLRFRLGQAIAIAICEPQVRLGRRRHDGRCDACGEALDAYAMEKLEFPLSDLSPDATSKRQKIRSMLDAEYVRVCLECGDDLEDGDRDD